MAHQESLDVVIVGGGHAGLLLGAALSARGFSLRLIERQPAESIETASPDGRNLALLAGSAAVVRRLGAWRRLAPLVEPIIQGSGWRTAYIGAGCSFRLSTRRARPRWSATRSPGWSGSRAQPG